MRRPTRGGARRRGLTLVELLLALAITAMIGLAMSTMVISVARGVTAVSDGRSAVQRTHVVHTRLRAYTDTALAVLQNDPDRGFVLWLHDGPGDGHVNLTEFRVFWFDGRARTLSVEWVSFPEDWTPEQRDAADLRVALVEDFFAVMETQRAFGHTRRAVLGDEIEGLSLQHAGADPLSARCFTLRARASASWTSDAGVGRELLFRLALPEYAPPEGAI